MQSIFWMFRKQHRTRNKTINHIIMKRQNYHAERISLPYESPDATFVEVKAEGVLCISGENDDEYNEVDFEW